MSSSSLGVGMSGENTLGGLPQSQHGVVEKHRLDEQEEVDNSLGSSHAEVEWELMMRCEV